MGNEFACMEQKGISNYCNIRSEAEKVLDLDSGQELDPIA